MRTFFHVLGLLCMASLPGGLLACEPATFPASQGLYRDAVPELAWAPVADATSYLVEVVARVPEGPVVDGRTLRTAQTSVDLPRLDPSRPTKIVLTVTAECGARRATPASRTMVVTTRSNACAPVSGLSVRATASERSLSWTGRNGLDYEVRAFDAMSGALTLNLKTHSTSGIVIPGRAPSVIAVRPVCRGSTGATSYLFAS